MLAALLSVPLPVAAQDKAFGLAVPAALAETGLMDYILPRFSLKTGIRVTQDAGADFALGDDGVPVFKGPTQMWHLTDSVRPAEERFRDWLQSDIGKRTVESFTMNGSPAFSAEVTQVVVVAAAPLRGDASRGKDLSFDLCGNCHVIGPENRMNSIGSTPSFMLMRSFADWRTRFETFYKRRPHGPFTHVEGVTNLPEPSPSTRTIILNRADVDSITAFVARIEPADLGAPLQFQ